MKTRWLLAPFAVLVMAAAASAEKGGEIPFKTDPQKAMRMAKAQGFGMMLYFTSEG